MFDTIHLTNMLRSEVEGIPETGLPLDAFPDKIQEIILNLARYENFNVEYTASIILSAVATAIGNSCHIRIKGEWKTCPSIYMMLVGRPGLGKTPPLGFVYKPINEYDDRLHEKYNEEYDEYERSMSAGKHGSDGEEQLLKKPHFVTTVIYDSTPEAMMNIHQHNRRGITLVVDEILALFNSVKRYNGKNNLIEDLLTAYSGQSLKIIRKSESRPVLIKNPCINVIGSVQTNMLQEVFRAEFLANGLLDRFLFVYPKNRKISGWRREERNTVNLTGCHIGIFIKTLINESLIMSQIQVCLCTIVCYKNFSVLNRVHGSGVDIDIGIQFLNRHRIAACLQQAGDRRRNNAFTERRSHAARHENVLGFAEFHYLFRIILFAPSFIRLRFNP